MSKKWNSGYDAGFIAGWQAAQKNGNESGPRGVYTVTPTGSYSGTMAENPYNISTTVDYGTVTLTETKSKKPDLKVIRNLTDHTRIV